MKECYVIIVFIFLSVSIGAVEASDFLIGA